MRVSLLGVLLGHVVACGGASSAAGAAEPGPVAAPEESAIAARGRGAATPLAPAGPSSPPPRDPEEPCREESSDYVPQAGALSRYGGRDVALSIAVAERIRASSSSIRACYEAELALDPSLSGALRVLFTVQRDGSVVDVVAEENALPPQVASCVVSNIDALHFSPGPRCGPATFRFPFVFEPGD